MTIDLRQAPFMLWIDDMSIPDPFYVLPIMMGLSMVIQQKIMPTTMDPTQAFQLAQATDGTPVEEEPVPMPE